MDASAARWKARFGLMPHPEGGYFRETYRSAQNADFAGLGPRSISSAILYLLVRGQKSAFHRLRCDEIWHYYAGGALSLYLITEGKLIRRRLGSRAGASPQVVVPGGTWVAASVSAGRYCLAGCTVAPGFDYRDWEIGTKAALLKLYPELGAVIERYATI